MVRVTDLATSFIWLLYLEKLEIAAVPTYAFSWYNVKRIC